MLDEMILSGLKVYAWHGVYEEEREKGQNFIINARIFYDTVSVAETDSVEDTIDYAKVSLYINEYMRVHQFNLIETVANKLARKLLIKFPLIQSIELEVMKPEAPIPVPFSNVSVRVNRGWHKVYIATGSNMGDSEQFIRDAMDNLDSDENCRVLRKAKMYESRPYGGVDQDNYINSAFCMNTLYSPLELLTRLQEEEKNAGRERNLKWGPRTLDLDILYYDDLIMERDHLRIPHVDMANRDFVLLPLSEIAPYKRHPILGLTTLEMLSRLKETYVETLKEEE
ncbi:MAG: 2-amino-4-hydroxy-6-hydroxymethyldihydropteridine diphosphokinase [Lachnospiraceae bacterium]|nr:2-amino-4-hydroxy-6-hydroxymethyldihydropteridine diphosphokinase [Lachnospiraceae bacterium]MBQ6637229.1 2-amino-4-hydroxy-6-hydroxymethyldihydropteridine diphosphokinase [Lachnospiraceae bacterium]